MKGYGPKTFGERMAEGDDSWCGNPSEAQTRDTVAVLAEPAAGGRVLELRERQAGRGRSPFTAASSGMFRGTSARAEIMSFSLEAGRRNGVPG